MNNKEISTISTPFLPVGMCVLERGWLSANNILFTDGEQTLMIDSGYCTHSEQTVAWWKVFWETGRSTF